MAMSDVQCAKRTDTEVANAMRALEYPIIDLGHMCEIMVDLVQEVVFPADKADPYTMEMRHRMDFACTDVRDRVKRLQRQFDEAWRGIKPPEEPAEKYDATNGPTSEGQSMFSGSGLGSLTRVIELFGQLTDDQRASLLGDLRKATDKTPQVGARLAGVDARLGLEPPFTGRLFLCRLASPWNGGPAIGYQGSWRPRKSIVPSRVIFSVGPLGIANLLSLAENAFVSNIKERLCFFSEMLHLLRKGIRAILYGLNIFINVVHETLRIFTFVDIALQCAPSRVTHIASIAHRQAYRMQVLDAIGPP
jgi:hypothetical protein